MEQLDVIVVGSGFGGAVTAARLAQAGMRVVVLERGPWWGQERPWQSGGARRAFPRGADWLRRGLRSVRYARGERSLDRMFSVDGLYELHVFEHLTALVGSGVGGGSLIYTNIQREPPARFFEAFPEAITAAALRPFYEKVRSVLRPAPLPADATPSRRAAFEGAASRAGLGEVEYPELAVVWGPGEEAALNAAGVRQPPCNLCGGCVVGCERGSKTTLDLTYIPLALQAGAALRPLAEVVALGPVRGGGYEVRWIDHRSGRLLQQRARRVVLAAGTLNTLRLLFAARGRDRALTRISPTLGRGFSGNGDAAQIVWGRTAGGALAEGPAFNAFIPRGDHLIGEAGLPVDALGVPRWVQRRVDRLALLVAMGRDGARGDLTWDGANLRTELGRRDDAALYDLIRREIDALTDAWGGEAPFAVGLQAAEARLATVHPLGGAALADDPGRGVVDHRGEVFGHPGLYIADGTIYPAAPGVPPSMTIAALAERIAHLMICPEAA